MILVLPDQCSMDLAPFEGAGAEQHAVCMAEIDPATDGQVVHRQRLAVVFAAMRHFRDRLRDEGFSVHYQRVGAKNGAASQAEFLRKSIDELSPESVVVSEPCGYELLGDLQDAAERAGTDLDVREDPTFLCTMDDFRAWADGRERMTMEYFYREQRRAYGYLMNASGGPAGGSWNFDEDNREAFDEAPQGIKAPTQFRPDDLTKRVIADIEDAFPDAYGQTDNFAYPVTPAEAKRAVRDFVENRLPHFGTHQDAMWTDKPFLYHSRLSAAINLRLVSPRYVLDKAEAAYRDGDAPINAVEGFVRQILGWREFVRGVYWTGGKGYEQRNTLNARRELPDLFWTGETDMVCMSDCIDELNENAYLHHIQRLMVTGLFGMLYGVKPQAMDAWHLAMYADAWPWVSAPNMVGMSQYADEGVVGTKPYAASGNYINKMSNYCANCSYDYRDSTGDEACPFTTLYWDFLLQHEEKLQENRRMNFQMKNVANKGKSERDDVRERAEYIRRKVRKGKA